jgi:hypothetical protein
MTSGEYLIAFFFIAPFSQMLGPPRFPGRFRHRLVRDYEQRVDVSRQMIYVATGSLLLKRLFDTN